MTSLPLYWFFGTAWKRLCSPKVILEYAYLVAWYQDYCKEIRSRMIRSHGKDNLFYIMLATLACGWRILQCIYLKRGGRFQE